MSEAIWRVRREGSGRVIGPMSEAEVFAGLLDEQWESTDEVAGPNGNFQPLEAHPHFAEQVAELTEPPRQEPPDETRLDMNPLIDVALVLLIFFILTTTYEQIRKVLDVPTVKKEQLDKSPPKMSPKQIRELAIQVTGRMENNQPIVRVEEEVIAVEKLADKLSEWTRKVRKSTLFIDVADGVPWGTTVAILDAAKKAGISDIITPAPKPGE